jgi:uncharacterized protein YegP (UPF0339 family)
MRDKYDFSQGEQGRYAARAAEGVVLPRSPESTCVFEIYKDQAGLFHWRLKTTAGEIIVASEATYRTSDACVTAIESFRMLTHKATVSLAS